MKITIVNGIDTWKIDTDQLPIEIKDKIEPRAEEIIKIIDDLIYHSGMETNTEIRLKGE